MARYVRNGSVLSVYVGRLQVARVVGMGKAPQLLEVRTGSGGWAYVRDIPVSAGLLEPRAALGEMAGLVQWVMDQTTKEVTLAE